MDRGSPVQCTGRGLWVQVDRAGTVGTQRVSPVSVGTGTCRGQSL